MGVVLRIEHEIDLGDLTSEINTTDKWALLDVLMDDLAKEGTEEDWADFWETYKGWPRATEEQ